MSALIVEKIAKRLISDKWLLNQREKIIKQSIDDGELKQNLINLTNNVDGGNHHFANSGFGENGTDTNEKRKNWDRVSELSKKIQYANIALDRIDKGVYQTCALCQNDIPKNRLEALPMANTCINCSDIQKK